jgi:hypothetical protein
MSQLDSWHDPFANRYGSAREDAASIVNCDLTTLPHEMDHIRARKHRGATSLPNTCIACANCNGAKGSNVAGYDPVTDELVVLFHPRRDTWDDHFIWEGATWSAQRPPVEPQSKCSGSMHSKGCDSGLC